MNIDEFLQNLSGPSPLRSLSRVLVFVFFEDRSLLCLSSGVLCANKSSAEEVEGEQMHTQMPSFACCLHKWSFCTATGVQEHSVGVRLEVWPNHHQQLHLYPPSSPSPSWPASLCGAVSPAAMVNKPLPDPALQKTTRPSPCSSQQHHE